MSKVTPVLLAIFFISGCRTTDSTIKSESTSCTDKIVYLPDGTYYGVLSSGTKLLYLPSVDILNFRVDISQNWKNHGSSEPMLIYLPSFVWYTLYQA